MGSLENKTFCAPEKGQEASSGAAPAGSEGLFLQQCIR